MNQELHMERISSSYWLAERVTEADAAIRSLTGGREESERREEQSRQNAIWRCCIGSSQGDLAVIVRAARDTASRLLCIEHGEEIRELPCNCCGEAIGLGCGEGCGVPWWMCSVCEKAECFPDVARCKGEPDAPPPLGTPCDECKRADVQIKRCRGYEHHHGMSCEMALCPDCFRTHECVTDICADCHEMGRQQLYGLG